MTDQKHIRRIQFLKLPELPFDNDMRENFSKQTDFCAFGDIEEKRLKIYTVRDASNFEKRGLAFTSQTVLDHCLYWTLLFFNQTVTLTKFGIERDFLLLTEFHLFSFQTFDSYKCNKYGRFCNRFLHIVVYYCMNVWLCVQIYFCKV